MIELNRIHGNGCILVNADLVETVEATPDTVITLVTKRRFIVENSVDDVVKKIINYRAEIAKEVGAIVHSIDSATTVRAITSLEDNEEKAA